MTLATGIAELDAILDGGLPSGGLAIIVGPPGVGKTTIAQQVTFHRARTGEHVLFLTGFAESHARLIELGKTFRFFDEALVGSVVHLGSMPDLFREGSGQSERDILETVRQHPTRLVVLDGFRLLGLLVGGGDEQAAARFLYGLATKLALLGATLLVLMEGDGSVAVASPSLGVADVLITLQSETRAGRERRLLQVRKRRGGAPLQGLHPYHMDADGVHLWPRFESMVGAAEAAWSSDRETFGKPQIDGLLHGGLTVGTVTLAAGSFGTGKTLLGLHFAGEGVALGQPTLVLSFMESTVQLREKGRAFGLQLDTAEDRGLLKVLSLPSHELEADRVCHEIGQDVERRGVRRLVVDSAAQLERSISDLDRREGFLSALVSYLRSRQVTTYMTYELPRMGPDLGLADTPLAVLAENLLLLRATESDGRIKRLFSIVHMRFSGHDDRVHEYRIEAGRGMLMVDSTADAEHGRSIAPSQPWSAR